MKKEIYTAEKGRDGRVDESMYGWKKMDGWKDR